MYQVTSSTGTPNPAWITDVHNQHLHVWIVALDSLFLVRLSWERLNGLGRDATSGPICLLRSVGLLGRLAPTKKGDFQVPGQVQLHSEARYPKAAAARWTGSAGAGQKHKVPERNRRWAPGLRAALGHAAPHDPACCFDLLCRLPVLVGWCNAFSRLRVLSGTVILVVERPGPSRCVCPVPVVRS